MFTFTADIESRCSLRSASDGKLAIPRTRIQFGNRAFSVAGARQWNALHVELRNIDDFGLLKAKLTLLLQMYFTYVHCNCGAGVEIEYRADRNEIPLATPMFSGSNFLMVVSAIL